VKIRTKLILSLCLPLIALGAVVGKQLNDQRAQAQEAARTAKLARTVRLAGRVGNELQLDFTANVLPTDTQAIDLAARRAAGEGFRAAALQDLDRALGELGSQSLGPEVQHAADNVAKDVTAYKAELAKSPLSSLDRVEDRARLDALHAKLAALHSDLVVFSYAVGRSIEHDGELARRALGYASLMEVLEQNANAIYRLTLEGGAIVDKPTVEEVSQLRSHAALALQIFGATATDAEREELDRVLRQEQVTNSDAYLGAAATARPGTLCLVCGDVFFSFAEQKLDLLRSYANTVGANLELQADRKHEAATSAASQSLFVGLSAIGAALALGLFLVGGIVRRLRRLTTGVHALADEQLPAMVESLRDPGAGGALIEPKPLEDLGRDELGELGHSFNALQTAFVGVARDQVDLLRSGIADIFVKLARRNQSLVERQIELLDGLESQEKDPEVLENLFRLDHLATRIRRNAESLLVLAGSEQPRKWSEPVPLTEFLQAAAAEVEDFGRIRVVRGDGSVAESLAVVGPAALDLTHLFAELLDNALRFSPPDTPVEILSLRRGDNTVVYVSDCGMGLTEDQLEEANSLLANPPEPGLDLSRTLGLYVVAKLAERHGVTVKLSPSPFDGIVAAVSLPPELVVQVRSTSAAVAEPPAAPVESSEDSAPAGPMPLPVRDPRPVPRTDRPAPVEQANGGHSPAAADDTPPAEEQPNVAPAAAAPPAVGNGRDSGPASLPQRADAKVEEPERPGSIGATASHRSPAEKRQQLASFRHGLEEGRRAGDTQTSPPADQEAS
jgi:signal transduction histidine kinase